MRWWRCLAGLLPALLCAQTGAVVQGTVLDRVTHAGVPGVEVTLWTQQALHYTSTTNAAGNYTVADVKPGDYSSRYEKPGFLPSEMPRFGEQPLRVGLGGTYLLDSEIAKLATLRGRVLDAEGNPMAKVTVQIGVFDDETDAEGRFSFTELRPGTFTILATPIAAKGGTANTERTQLMPTYFPSALDDGDAERIRIRGGEDLAGFDIRLRSSAVFHVRGVVVDAAGKPVPEAEVKLLKPAAERLLTGMEVMGGVHSYLNLKSLETEGKSVFSDASGRFEFAAVRPGDWQLKAALDPRHDESNNIYPVGTSLVPAGITDSDLDGVVLKFEPDFALDAEPDWGDGKPPQGGYAPFLRLIPAGDSGFLLVGRTKNGKTAHFAHISPGRYRAEAGAPAGYYAAALLVDGRDVINSDFELNASSSIRIVYRPNPGKVYGTVENGEGAAVLLWRLGSAAPDVVPNVKAGPQGSFSFENVTPGTYSVIAFDRVDPQSADRAFILAAVANARQLKVEELGAASVTVPLSHWPD